MGSFRTCLFTGTKVITKVHQILIGIDLLNSTRYIDTTPKQASCLLQQLWAALQNLTANWLHGSIVFIGKLKIRYLFNGDINMWTLFPFRVHITLREKDVSFTSSFWKNQTEQPGRKKECPLVLPARAVILNDWANSFECNPAMKKKIYGPSIPFETITIDTNHNHHLRIGIEQVGNVTERWAQQ